MKNLVEVVPYNLAWPTMFEIESQHIKQALGENCIAIHHIGSTSVPGLNAKPIIDILPVVINISDVDKTTAAMENLGYEAKGEYGIPFRRFFQKSNVIRTHNVHVFENINPEVERHLKFRDWLRKHTDDRDAYAKLKISLAEKFPNDLMSYCLGKDEFIANIDAKAGFNQLRVVKALSERDWETIRHFRQKYIFDKVPVVDPYTWTFDHKDHVHFVLYQGMNRVGYAHIQLWNNFRAALRIIVIDEPYRKHGMGSYLLSFVEKWVKSQGFVKLHIQSSTEAYHFYVHHQYNKMPFNDPDGHESDARDIEIGKDL